MRAQRVEMASPRAAETVFSVAASVAEAPQGASVFVAKMAIAAAAGATVVMWALAAAAPLQAVSCSPRRDGGSGRISGATPVSFALLRVNIAHDGR